MKIYFQAKIIKNLNISMQKISYLSIKRNYNLSHQNIYKSHLINSYFLNLKSSHYKDSRAILIIANRKVNPKSKIFKMLRQRPPNTANQSAMFTKKQKKRSTSTSRNKENMSISHNQSNSMEYSLIQEKNQQNIKSIKVANKQKAQRTKKTKNAQIKQRSISRISNQASTLQVGDNLKILNLQNKQTFGASKKPKIRNTDDNQLHTKSYMIHQASYQIDYKNQKRPIKQQINEPILSKTSTIISASTGNIQFSDRSKDDKKMKILQLPEQNHFNGVEINSKFNKKLQSGNFNFQSKSKRHNPTKAAIMIQKTWRGYLTRKLLEEYIESFQPLYEQQLKEIRSSRQSCHQIKYTTKRQQRQKSSFFDQSGLDECSQISLLEEEKKVVQSSKRKRNVQNNDLPLQLSKKSNIKSSNDEKFTSTQRSIKTNQQKQKTNSNNKVSEFTVKNNFFECEKASSFRQQSTLSLDQQTTKITTTRKHKQFSIQNTISQKINPSTSVSSQSDTLHHHCQSLQKLFTSLNTECISQLKKQIKKNNLNLNELMQRKDALKDIVENGKEFVRNVLDEMTKAFEEMKRITIKGCYDNQQSQKSSLQSSERQVQYQSNQSNSKNQAKINLNQKQFKKNKNQSPQLYHEKQYNLQGQFHNIIDLPTEQYSVKGRSPIQQDYDQNSSESNDDNNDDDQDNRSQNHQHQQSEITQSFNQHQQQQQSSSQQQSLSNEDEYPLHQQSIEILNQFLINLIDEFTELSSSSKSITELQYLCQTLKRVSCDSQNKTIIDRCLIEFIVEIMSQTWTLREIYEGFKCIVMRNQGQINQMNQHNQMNQDDQQQDYDWKLYSTIRRWLDELQKWEMNIIKEVPSKMQSSSFINTAQNISFNQLREQIDCPYEQEQSSDLQQYQQY